MARRPSNASSQSSGRAVESLSDHAGEIMRILGRLEEGVGRLRDDFEEEKLTTRESRGRTYDKLEAIGDEVAAAAVEASAARREAEILKKLIESDVKPATDDFKHMRTIGFVGLTVFGVAFTALGVTVANFSDAAVSAVRAWLHIL